MGNEHEANKTVNNVYFARIPAPKSPGGPTSIFIYGVRLCPVIQAAP